MRKYWSFNSITVGQRHAQALVFPLSVAIKSPRVERIQAANSLMYSLRQHSLKVIDHALLVSEVCIPFIHTV